MEDHEIMDTDRPWKTKKNTDWFDKKKVKGLVKLVPVLNRGKRTLNIITAWSLAVCV